MKNFIFTIVFLQFSNILFCQDRLGYSETQIKNEFQNKNLEIGFLKNKTKYLHWKTSDIDCVYFFNKESLCDLFILYIFNTNTLKSFKKKYNDSYILISDSIWEKRLGNDTIVIKLMHPSKNEIYFKFTSSKIPLVRKNSTAFKIVTDTSSKNDLISGSFYKNTRYKFRVNFIENWEIDKGGNLENILIRSYQPDSGKTVSIGVTEIANQVLKDAPYTQDDKKKYIENLEIRGYTINDCKVERGWLNNFPANIITTKFIKRDLIHEISFFMKQIQCTLDGKMYFITVSIPESFYNSDEENRIWRVVSSFKFENFPIR